MHQVFIGRRKYGSTVRIILEMFLPSRNMNLYYDSNVRILIHKYYLFAFSTSRRLSSFNTATASLIVRGRLSYARRWLNRSATEIILLSAALPVLRTAAESGEGSPERLDEGTALHSLRIFLFVVCVGSTSHAAAARDVVVGMSWKLCVLRGIANAGSSDQLAKGVRFGSVRFVCYECQVRVRRGLLREY